MFAVKRTKTFVHKFINVNPTPRIDIDGIRHYQTPVGTFKSVTTILGEKLDKSGLHAWKERVGEEEAAKIATQAARRGSAIHNLAEAYLMNVENWKKGAMPVNLDTFSRIRPILDKHVATIYGIEIPLYSARLKAAGTCDLLASFDGVNSVIDFKTSRRIKKEDNIEGYFLQATAYSMMAEELSDMKFPQIVIIMSVDNEESLVFIKQRDDYVKRVLEVFA